MTYKPSPWGTQDVERGRTHGYPDAGARQREAAVHGAGQYSCEEVLSFRGIRSAVMTRAWDEVRRREAAGRLVSTRDFGDIVSGEWDRAQAAANQCTYGQWIV